MKPLDIPFDGLGLVTGAVFDTGAPIAGIGSAVPINELGSGLASDAPYHRRCVSSRSLRSSRGRPGSRCRAITARRPTSAPVPRRPASRWQNRRPGAVLRIQAAAPNPFVHSTDISYVLPLPGRVWLAIYDVTGRQCAVLVDGTQAAGRQRRFAPQSPPPSGAATKGNPYPFSAR